MKRLIVFSLLCGAFVLGGCATKKYVAQQMDPLSAKVSTVDKNQQATQKQLDAAEPRISAADEKATAADNRATDAIGRADAASKKADEVRDSLRTELNSRIANLDDYKSSGEVTVLFAFNSDKLSEEATQQLDQLAGGQLASAKRYFVAIQGFTDKIGAPEYNLDLSRRRAQAVQTYLVGEKKIPVYRIQIVGLGETNPVNDEKTRADREKNRRVEVTLFTAETAEGSAMGSSQ